MAEHHMTEQAGSAYVEDILSLLGHDLKTPMGAIQGYVTLIEEYESEGLSPNAASYVNAISQACDSLLMLTNMILENTRLEFGHWMELQSELSFAELVREAVKAVEPLASNKGIAVEMSGDPAVTLVDDRRALRAALIDVLIGAIKLSRNGGVVRVELSGDEEALRVIVRDGGRAVPAEVASSIFDRFIDSHGPLKGSRQGMYVAAEVFTSRGWSIELRGLPEGGNEFRMEKQVGKKKVS